MTTSSGQGPFHTFLLLLMDSKDTYWTGPLIALSESNGRPTGEHFTIKYHDMNDVVDFLVLRQTFNSYKGKWVDGEM